MTQIIMSGDMGPQKGQKQAAPAAKPELAGALKGAAAAVAA